MKPSKPAASPFAWQQAWTFADAARARPAFEGFAPSRKAERDYERKLLGVAEQIAGITRMGGRPEDIERLLREYAKSLEPWAAQSAANMLFGVNRKNRQAWQKHAARMGLEMRTLLQGGLDPGGQIVQAAIAENVSLIKSLALDSADRVAKIAAEALISGSRAEDLAKRIEEVGEVSKSRARTIAHTEVSKAGTALTKGRAESVGSPGYIWRTARDGDTRMSHRAMEGEFVPWNKPPTLDNMTGHAGEFPNCRCYPEPVIPRADGKQGVYRAALPTQAQEKNAGKQIPLSRWEKEGGDLVRHAPGQLLANVDQAHIPSRKLAVYALDPRHPRGKDKAAAFYSALGFENSKEHRDALARQVLEKLHLYEPIRRPEAGNRHGELFSVDMPVKGPNGKTVVVRSNWIYDRNEKTGVQSAKPRLTTIMVKKKRNKEDER